MPLRHDPTLALTPPMGWNSWNRFGRNISDALIRQTAEAMVNTGLRDAGYQYVVIDDCWHDGRDRAGRLQPDSAKFPHGIKPLADCAHSLGLRLGIYSCAGVRTCAGLPGSYGLEHLDAATFAEWGVDYLKYDYCFAPDSRDEAIRRYTAMGEALRECGRPIVFSACEWGTRQPWDWPPLAHGHLARTSFDIIDSWDGTLEHSNAGNSVLTILDRQQGLEQYAAIGRWNDMDMLIVGLCGRNAVGGQGCTDDEYRAHFGLWCLLASPLMASCDLTAIEEPARAILTHREAIAINQDPCGHQGYRVRRERQREIYVKPLATGEWAVGLLNRGSTPASITARAADFRLWSKYTVRDVWQQRDDGVYTGDLTREVPAHSLILLRLAPVAPLPQP